MDEIDKLINDLEEKSKTSFEEIDLLLDSVDNLIQNTNKELSSENNNDDSKTREILSKKETELRKLKLIPKLNRICNSYYHKYKEVNKKIDENIKGVNYLNNKSLTKFIGNVDEKLINEMILDYLIRKGNLKTVERFIEESRVDPSKLMEAAKEIIEKAIEYGGTTIRSYTSSLGVTGRYQDYLEVHTKEGEKCPECGTIIKKEKVGGRSTYYCPRCQK